jgi:HPt (histidine-containing phosphotransfer) domain-containing protein
LDTNDDKTAQRLAHTIKGVSGSIGAGDLFSAAEKLDAAFKKKQRDTYDDLLSRLRDALAPVMQGLEVMAAFGETQQTAPLDTEPVDLEALTPLLDELQTLLEEMDPEAEEKVAALKTKLVQEGDQELIKKLYRQVNEFEFEEALQTLNKLKKVFKNS